MCARHVDGANVIRMNFDLDKEIEYMFGKKQLEYEDTHPVCPQCGRYMEEVGTYIEHWYNCKCGYCMVKQ